MDALRSTATTALRDLLSTQPNTAEKMRFAWRIAAGPSMARAARIEWSAERGLTIRPQSETWRREIVRARPILVERIAQLVGRDAVRRFVVEPVGGRRPGRTRPSTSEE